MPAKKTTTKKAAPRVTYQECPDCGEKKVKELTEGERHKIRHELINYQIITPEMHLYRIFACLNCGFVAAMRWAKGAGNPMLHQAVKDALDS